MTIYNPELNPYDSVDDYTLEGLYTPFVDIEKQEEEKKPKKVTTDVKFKEVIVQTDDSKTSLDSKDMFINNPDDVVTTSVSSKEVTAEAVKASEKSEGTKVEEVCDKNKIKAENGAEDVIEPPKRKRGRPRKVDVEASRESK